MKSRTMIVLGLTVPAFVAFAQPTPPAKPAAADPNINAIRKGSNATLGK